MAGDPRFHAELAKLGEMHDRKQEDYGTDHDPFANVRASQDFGVPAWVGALVRLNDKVTRLKNFAVKGQLANESAVDSMLDIAVYAVIAKVLYDEASGEARRAELELEYRRCGDPDCACAPQDRTPWEQHVAVQLEEVFANHEREDGQEGRNAT